MIPQRRSIRRLSLCGIRCNIGTDELFFPTLFTIALKTTWTFVALISAIHLFLHSGCPTLAIPTLLAVSVIGFMVIQVAGIVNDITIIVTSTRGSLSNFSPRRKIEIFMYIGCLVYLIEIFWDIYSTYTVFSPPVTDEQYTNCTTYSTSLTIYKAVILSHWGLEIIILAMFIFLLDPLNCCLLSAKFNDIEEVVQILEEERDTSSESGAHSQTGVHSNPFNCAVWCSRCCKKDGVAANSRNNALRDLVHLFRVIFDGLDTEYTYLDLVAGFRLQLIYHSKLRRSGNDPTHLIKKKTVEILSKDEEYTMPSGPKQLNTDDLYQYSKDLKYYLKYAMAIYGWKIHVYQNPVRGPASLCCNTRGSCCCGACCPEPHFEGDRCLLDQAAVVAMTGVEAEDIITASFVNHVDIVPFFVVKVDRDGKKEVIVAIRGTLSIKDALTDVSARMKEMPGGLLGVTPSFIHRGIYKAALGVYDHLKANATFTELASNPEYRIVLTGHSLGAGVASVLAVLLKEEHPDWSENLVAFNFATPPVFSYALAEKSQSFITTVVSGYDIVPRMTIRGLGHLVLSVKDLIDNSKDTKQNVLCCIDCKNPEVDADKVQQRQEDTLLQLDVKCPGTVEEADGPNDSTMGLLTKMKTKRKFKLGRHLLDHLAKLVVMEKTPRKESLSSREESDRHAMMFTPGRIMHLEVHKVNMLKRCSSCGLKKAGEVKASWKSREDFSGIDVHTSMLLDHGPTRTIDFVTTFCDQLTESQA